MNAIRDFRKKTSITQKNLSDLLGCSKSQVALTEINLRSLPKASNDLLFIMQDCMCKSSLSSIESLMPPCINTPELKKNLRQKLWKLDSLEIQQDNILASLDSATALVKFLISLKSVPIIKKKLEYKYQERVAKANYQRLKHKSQLLHVEIMAMKSAVAALKKLIDDNKI